jgi:hypothetical protein
MGNLRKSENLAVLVWYIDCDLVRLDSVVCSSMTPEVKFYIRDVSEDSVQIWTTMNTTFIKPVSAPSDFII